MYITIKDTPGTNKKDNSEELIVVNCSFFNNLTPSNKACKKTYKTNFIRT
uniref:Uncharacterized protein n=1 Tax=Heterorhabditis bacteriophora TaxID=37862 RepID=A0A1I7WDN7_HETBA